LAAILLFTDFENKYKIKLECLRGLILVSGVYDLTPLIKTSINEALNMNVDEATDLSPLNRKQSFLSKVQIKTISILIAYGEHESPSFKSQSNKFKDVK
jgi:arylformamidase